jgi:hypothetical protein
MADIPHDGYKAAEEREGRSKSRKRCKTRHDDNETAEDCMEQFLTRSLNSIMKPNTQTTADADK